MYRTGSNLLSILRLSAILSVIFPSKFLLSGSKPDPIEEVILDFIEARSSWDILYYSIVFCAGRWKQFIIFEFIILINYIILYYIILYFLSTKRYALSSQLKIKTLKINQLPTFVYECQMRTRAPQERITYLWEGFAPKYSDRNLWSNIITLQGGSVRLLSIGWKIYTKDEVEMNDRTIRNLIMVYFFFNFIISKRDRVNYRIYWCSSDCSYRLYDKRMLSKVENQLSISAANANLVPKLIFVSTGAY